jgi:hypothetical protein
VVIGDWRDENKGSRIVELLRKKATDIEFRQLSFKPGSQEAFYLEADLFLCLSVSEGFSYAVADADACGLPIVMTNVGLAGDFPDVEIIDWEERQNVDLVLEAVRRKLKDGRKEPSFFKDFTFEHWSSLWKKFVGEKKEIVEHKPAPATPPPPPPKKPEPKSVEPPPRPLYAKKPGQLIIIGLGGGLGNAIFNIPLMHVLTGMGRRVAAYVETDYPSAALFDRCKYLESVIRPDQPPPVQWDCKLIAGPWRPKRMFGMSQVEMHTWAREPIYPEPEWSLLLKFAKDLGWNGRKPDVSDWCRGLDRSFKWDVGIVQGAKPEARWQRKRYPDMFRVAQALIDKGLKVAVFGTEEDREIEIPIPGEDLLGKIPLDQMPDALAGCRAVVGTDSGMTHLASSLGVPTVVIYTSTSEVKGEPVGRKFIKLFRDIPSSPCQSTYRWDQCNNWICRDVPVDEVLRATMAMLEWSPASPAPAPQATIGG